MLSIKKRYPFNAKYAYYSAAFLVGYAGIMAFLAVLPQRVAFENIANSATTQTEVEPAKTESQATTETDAPVTETAAQSSQATIPSQSQPEQPVTQTPVVETPTEPEPTPTKPTTPVEPEPTPEQPADPIGDILDVILP